MLCRIPLHRVIFLTNFLNDSLEPVKDMCENANQKEYGSCLWKIEVHSSQKQLKSYLRGEDKK